jgi:hypothetical protein
VGRHDTQLAIIGKRLETLDQTCQLRNTTPERTIQSRTQVLPIATMLEQNLCFLQAKRAYQPNHSADQDISTQRAVAALRDYQQITVSTSGE